MLVKHNWVVQRVPHASLRQLLGVVLVFELAQQRVVYRCWLKMEMVMG